MWVLTLSGQFTEVQLLNNGVNQNVTQVVPNARLCFLSGMKAGTQNSVQGIGANSCNTVPQAGGWILSSNNVSMDPAVTQGTGATFCTFTCLY